MTYTYERADGTRFEVEQRIIDRPLRRCPKTGQRVKRVITKPEIIFKGEGWS